MNINLSNDVAIDPSKTATLHPYLCCMIRTILKSHISLSVPYLRVSPINFLVVGPHLGKIKKTNVCLVEKAPKWCTFF